MIAFLIKNDTVYCFPKFINTTYCELFPHEIKRLDGKENMKTILKINRKRTLNFKDDRKRNIVRLTSIEVFASPPVKNVLV